jgi:nicotinamide-nucleotide amidase
MAIDIFTDSGQREAAEYLGSLLLKHQITCAVAESCTGGMVGAAITSIAGSSAWFRGGVIAYSNDVKNRLLRVPGSVLLEQGAVSAETVVAMAAGVADLLGTETAVAVSGIAGPGGGSAEKPIGLVYIGVFAAGTAVAFRHVFTGGRSEVRAATVRDALSHLIEQIEKAYPPPPG